MLKNISTLFFLLLFFCLLAIGACKKDDDEAPSGNNITISIPTPPEDAVIPNTNPNVPVQVNIDAEQALFDIRITVYPKDDENTLLLDQQEEQNGNPLYSFFAELNMFNFAAGTQYVLKVEACGTAACADADKEVLLRNFSIAL